MEAVNNKNSTMFSNHRQTDQQTNNHQETNDNDKLFQMTLDTFIFSKRIIQHKENNNKINKGLSTVLYDVISVIESFLETAEIEENGDENSFLQDVKPSIDSSVLQAHYYYYCKACNQSVKSSNKAIQEHLFSNKHLKNLRILSEIPAKREERKPPKAYNDENNLENKRANSTHSLSGNENDAPKKSLKKKERLNSLPARVRDVFPKDILPKKMKEFLLKQNLDSFANDLVKEGQNVQKSQKHVRVCDLLKKQLIGRYPKIKIYPFGSVISGLGHEKTDLDIFIDTDDCFFNKLNKRKMKDAIFQTQRILAYSSNHWGEFEPIIRARTPILRVFCIAENIDCDLSFSNGLSTANTALISYLINLQPICKKLVVFIKFWAIYLNLGTNSYLLTLMVIFYLQQVSLLPPVSLLQERTSPVFIDMWNSGFATPNLIQLNVPMATDFLQYVIGFFKFYGYNFDFTNYCICILTGNRVPKHIFDHGREHLLPPVFKPFAIYMSKINLEEADEIEDLFANHKPLVIQDPFDLVHNVGKGIQEAKLNKIIHLMRCTYELLTNP